MPKRNPEFSAMRVTILRPGALGDVVVTRAALHVARHRLKPHELVLVAPGERGRLLCGPGLADRVVDYESSDMTWLFSDGSNQPPERLRTAIGGSEVVVAYLADSDGSIRARLRDLGCAKVIIHPARPDESGATHVHQHLIKAFQTWSGNAPSNPVLPPVPTDSELAKNLWPELFRSSRGYAVIHPGSGGKRKNWPAERFAELAERIAQDMPVVVTCGEADGSLGRDVVGKASGAVLIESPPLRALASLLAQARLYVGNDSGVSHLASAVRMAGSDEGRCVVLFGPTLPCVWAPTEAVTVNAPDRQLLSLQVDTVFRACRAVLSA